MTNGTRFSVVASRSNGKRGAIFFSLLAGYSRNRFPRMSISSRRQTEIDCGRDLSFLSCANFEYVIRSNFLKFLYSAWEHVDILSFRLKNDLQRRAFTAAIIERSIRKGISKVRGLFAHRWLHLVGACESFSTTCIKLFLWK